MMPSDPRCWHNKGVVTRDQLGAGVLTLMARFQNNLVSYVVHATAHQLAGPRHCCNYKIDAAEAASASDYFAEAELEGFQKAHHEVYGHRVGRRRNVATPDARYLAA